MSQGLAPLNLFRVFALRLLPLRLLRLLQQSSKYFIRECKYGV